MKGNGHVEPRNQSASWLAEYFVRCDACSIRDPLPPGEYFEAVISPSTGRTYQLLMAVAIERELTTPIGVDHFLGDQWDGRLERSSTRTAS